MMPYSKDTVLRLETIMSKSDLSVEVCYLKA